MTTARTSVKVDMRALDALAERYDDLAGLTRTSTAEVEKVALNAAQLLVGAVREQVLGWPSTSSVSTRTGALARSFREAASVTAGSIHISALSDLVYAGIHNTGGVIKPRTRKNLSIPMTREAARKWPRDWSRGELFRPKGKDYLAAANGAGIKVHYLLRKTVRIKAKRYLSKARDAAMPEITDLFLGYIRDKIAGARNG